MHAVIQCLFTQNTKIRSLHRNILVFEIYVLASGASWNILILLINWQNLKLVSISTQYITTNSFFAEQLNFKLPGSKINCFGNVSKSYDRFYNSLQVTHSAGCYWFRFLWKGCHRKQLFLRHELFAGFRFFRRKIKIHWNLPHTLTIFCLNLTKSDV